MIVPNITTYFCHVKNVNGNGQISSSKYPNMLELYLGTNQIWKAF